MPYDFHTVTESLAELIEESVLTVEGDILIQKRMVRDNAISEKRAIAGKKGGEKSLKKFAQANIKAKGKANSEYENESETESRNDLEEEGVGEGGESELNGFMSTDLPKDLKMDELQIGQTIEFIKYTCRVDLSPPEAEEYFEAFKIQNLGKKQWYNNLSEVFTHFRNSLKIDLKNNGKANRTNTNGPGSDRKRGTSSDRIDALKNW
ncbi:hypothetical protein ABDK00_014190 [Niabella insulamsoli]|uniref:hypothetical protein n=1 Tax=Niabella insulamsoli TaxID=3144874 RepID=UPI003D0E807E